MLFIPEGILGFFAPLNRRLRPARRLVVAEIPALPLTSRTAKEDGSVILELRALSKHFGGLKAVDEVGFEVRANTVHALIGPNGSGKTTLLNVLSGIYASTRGEILLDHHAIGQLKPHERAGRGLGRTFQNIRLFSAMSVLEKVIVGSQRTCNVLDDGEA